MVGGGKRGGSEGGEEVEGGGGRGWGERKEKWREVREEGGKEEKDRQTVN